jgi:hypothetical protein
MNMDLTIAELYRIFDFFNEKFYKNELEKPMIVVQSTGRSKGILGWCTSKKIWSDQENKEGYYEITISAEYLNRSIEELIGTLLHEMVHLHNLQFDIKDTSRSGSYHNKRFKEVAEEKGLIISYSKRIGWSLTELQETTRKLIEELNPSADRFRLARFSPSSGNGEGSKARSSTRKYVCPKCQTIIRATKDVSVVCCNDHEESLEELQEEFEEWCEDNDYYAETLW